MPIRGRAAAYRLVLDPWVRGGILILSHDGKLKLLIRGLGYLRWFGQCASRRGSAMAFIQRRHWRTWIKTVVLILLSAAPIKNIYAFKATDHDTSNLNGSKVYYYHPPGKNSLWMAPIYEFDDDGDGKFNEDPVGGMYAFDIFLSKPHVYRI